MPNPPQLVETPLGGGLQQKTEPAHVPFGEFTIARNIRQPRSGAVSKRPGNVKLTNQYQLTQNLGPASIDVSKGGALSANGSQLLISANAGTAAYSPAYGTFGTYRPGSEAIARRVGLPLPAILSGSTLRSYSMEPAFCSDGTNYFYIYIDSSENLWCTIQDIATGSIIQDRVQITSAGTTLWAVPLIVSGQFTVVYLTSGGVINMVGMAAPYTGIFTVAATLVASNAGIAANIDAAVVGTTFAVAYPISTTGITIKTFNAAGTNLATATTVTAANVLEIRLTYEALASLWLGYRLNAGPLNVAGFNSGTLGLQYAGAFQVVAANVSSFHLVSVAVSKVLVVASVGATFASVNGYLVDFTSGSGAIAIAGAADQCGTTFIASKPFAQDDRYYVWAQAWAYTGGAATSSEYNNLTPAQWTNILLDLRIDTGTTGTSRPARPVAVDAPRFAFPKPSVIISDAEFHIGVNVAPLSLVGNGAGKWSVLMGTRETAYVTPWSRLDTSFTDTARWRSAKLGNILLRSSGVVTNWTGSREIENGFLQHTILPTFVSTAGGSLAPNGAIFYYKIVPMALDDAGNVHRGIPSNPAFAQLGGTDGSFTITIPAYQATDRIFQDGSTTAPTYATYYEIYRSIANPGSLGTDIATNFVDTVPNTPSAATLTYVDTIAPATVAKGALCYTFGGALPNGCPPGALDIVAHQGRAWIISNDGSTLYFSKQIVDGEAVNFTDSFTMPLDDQASALASMDDKLVVFTNRKIYYLVGLGPADNGTQNDYAGFVRVQSTVGCVDRRSVVATGDGIFFQTTFGIYLLDRGLNVVFIGQPVADELTAYPVMVAASVHASQPWVYFYVTTANASAGERIVYDYRVQKWSVDSLPAVPVSATNTDDGTHSWLDTTGQVWQESAATYLDNGAFVVSDFETTMHAVGIDGWQNIARCQLLFNRSTPFDLTIQTRPLYGAVYDSPPTFKNDRALSAMPNFYGGPGGTVEFCPVSSKTNAIAVRVTDAAPTGGAALGTGQGAEFFALAFMTQGDPATMALVADAQRG